VAPGVEVLDVVRVVGVEQGAVHHRQRQVGSVARVVVLEVTLKYLMTASAIFFKRNYRKHSIEENIFSVSTIL
jgi:hypothetical protein